MTKLRRLLFILIILFSDFNLNATHYMGGEITWECLSNGRFRFKLTYYHECYTTNGGSAAQFDSPQTLSSNSPAGNITLNRVSWTDISPVCNPNTSFVHIICPTSGPGMPNGVSNMGAIQEHNYTSDQAYPNGVQISGVPPASGWLFYSGGCCHNQSTNLNAQPSWVIRSIMYPFLNTNTYPCFDSSPQFTEPPESVLCIGFPNSINRYSFDSDLDSLVYSWAGDSNQGSYNYGYSYTSPLPGTIQNVNNVPAVINPLTGEITFESYTQGAFMIIAKVSSYKNKIKVSEIFQEFQLVLITCGSNTSPDVVAPFQNSVTGLYTDYIDTVFAGEMVNFTISATDFEPLLNNTPQTVTLTVAGVQFGDNDTNASYGCWDPPCATLDSITPVSGLGGVQTIFSWQTDCYHPFFPYWVNNQKSRRYYFRFRFSDDFCPVPAIANKTVTIVVVDKPELEPPDSVNAVPDGSGNIVLSWIAPNDTLNSFNAYIIYFTDSIGENYSVLDTVFKINKLSFTHSSADTLYNYKGYYMRILSGCDMSHLSAPSDTVVLIGNQINVSGRNDHSVTFSVYPNPANDYLNVLSYSKSAQKKSIVVYDSHGSIVYERIIKLDPGINKWIINIGLLKPGIYFIRSGQYISKAVVHFKM